MGQFIDQIDRMSGSGLNAGTGEPAPGQPLASPSGTLVVAYDGQLGQRIAVSGLSSGTPAEALRLSSTTIGTLYGGLYQYVLFLSTSSATAARGQLVFWSDAAAMSVTPDVTAATTGLFAGVVINSTVVKGTYAWIQIGGIASILFGTITKTTPAVGDLVIVNQTPTNRGDILADATGITSLTLKSQIGVAYVDVPANTTISRVIIKPFGAAMAL